ncbi:hypothetical protein BD310DRAFT_130151 [Dichomitus squalens]|uniref:Uncharacterized protein n=1 Tax=Dichomitus squalens TaxID=114155 RepID=A0A4Q9PFM8_9APHY|nr:hypothetical protein BD310DRAFT_130151 [Dichomitus squalens]
MGFRGPRSRRDQRSRTHCTQVLRRVSRAPRGPCQLRPAHCAPNADGRLSIVPHPGHKACVRRPRATGSIAGEMVTRTYARWIREVSWPVLFCPREAETRREASLARRCSGPSVGWVYIALRSGDGEGTGVEVLNGCVLIGVVWDGAQVARSERKAWLFEEQGAHGRSRARALPPSAAIARIGRGGVCRTRVARARAVLCI